MARFPPVLSQKRYSEPAYIKQRLIRFSVPFLHFLLRLVAEPCLGKRGRRLPNALRLDGLPQGPQGPGPTVSAATNHRFSGAAFYLDPLCWALTGFNRHPRLHDDDLRG